MYGGDEEYDDEEEEIMQEDVWVVISVYFEEKGLVWQQLDLFDEFIQNIMQEIVDEFLDIEICFELQYNFGCQVEIGDVCFFFIFCVFVCCVFYFEIFYVF